MLAFLISIQTLGQKSVQISDWLMSIQSHGEIICLIKTYVNDQFITNKNEKVHQNKLVGLIFCMHKLLTHAKKYYAKWVDTVQRNVLKLILFLTRILK